MSYHVRTPPALIELNPLLADVRSHGERRRGIAGEHDTSQYPDPIPLPGGAPLVETR